MPAKRLTVFIIDDDASVRDSLALMLGLGGYCTELFADAESFLAACDPGRAGCVVTDLRLPGKSGIELQAHLRERCAAIPVVIITAHGDVPSARVAFQAQAVDFLEKPFDHAQLRAAIDRAFALEEHRLKRDDARRGDDEKMARLTARERDVLECAAKGLHAKEIASRLGISPRTVEVHKTRIMTKLEVRNVAELVRFAVVAKEAGR